MPRLDARTWLTCRQLFKMHIKPDIFVFLFVQTDMWSHLKKSQVNLILPVFRSYLVHVNLLVRTKNKKSVYTLQ